MDQLYRIDPLALLLFYVYKGDRDNTVFPDFGRQKPKNQQKNLYKKSLYIFVFSSSDKSLDNNII